MKRGTSTRAGLALCTFLVLLPQTGSGQPCCSASSAGEAGVVGRCHYAMLSTSLGIEHGLGFTDTEGEFQPYQSTRSSDAILTIAGGFRPFDQRFRVGAAMPFRGQYRAGGEDSATALRPGDLALSTGFLVLEDPMTGLDSAVPFVEPYVASTLATGVSPDQSSDPLGADTTSQGASTLSLGLKVIKFVTPSHAIRVSGEYRYAFSYSVHSRDDRIQLQPGPALEGVLGWTYEGSIFWSVGLQARLTFRDELQHEDEPIPGSEMRRLYTGLTYRHALRFPYWDLTASGGQDMLLGKNTIRSGLTFMLGIQRNFL